MRLTITAQFNNFFKQRATIEEGGDELLGSSIQDQDSKNDKPSDQPRDGV